MSEFERDGATTLYVTTKNKEEGIQIGRALVEANLAACANVLDSVTSIFSWEGGIQTETEAILIAKTQFDLIEQASTLVKSIHSYECPCIVALPIVGGNQDFLEWIKSETKG